MSTYEFTHTGYTAILHRFVEAGYLFAGFPDAKGLLERGDPFVLMRHDIDFSLEAAVELAGIEAELGIHSTFFFLVRTTLYNVFSIAGTEQVRQILGHGHALGLHFDCASYPDATTEADLSVVCNREVAMLENWFESDVEIVSYHRPSDTALSSGAGATAPRPHTYLPIYTEQITYRSDSRGEWGHGHPLESVAWRKRSPMHILVHPIWWRTEPTEPYETLAGFVDRMHTAQQLEIARNCKVFRVGRFAGVTNE